ncbi:MAG: glutamyl-tRNA reductase [Gemmatimonadota bacterium]
MSPQPIHVIGISHRTAPLGERERFAFPAPVARALLAGSDGEAFLLVTCNRTELYGIGAVERLTGDLLQAAGPPAAGLFALTGPAAVRHLCGVAAGLDSMVLGEPQILGQIRRAMADARAAGTLGPQLDELVRRALTLGRRVRAETALGRGLPSVPKVAAGVARLVFGDLAGRALLIVGTGKLGGLTARTLLRAGATSVTVTNRSGDAAAALAEAVGGRPAPFDALDDLLVAADIVITCTAAQEPVFSRARVAAAAAARPGRPLVMIDIAVPRDVAADARTIPGVRLFDLDDLREWGSAAVAPEAIAAAEALVEQATADYLAWSEGRAAVPLIRALQARADAILERELALLPAGEAGAARVFGRRLLRKLLHHPMRQLRDGAARGGESYLTLAQDLFALEPNGNGDDGPAAP